MKTNRHIIVNILFDPSSTLKELLYNILQISKMQLLLWIAPSWFYFNAYLSYAEIHIPDEQLFHKYLSLYKKFFRLTPFKLICLVESMVLYDLLKNYVFSDPIREKVRIEGGKKAHDWNDHQIATYGKILN